MSCVTSHTGGDGRPIREKGGANTHFRRHVAVNPVPGIAADHAARAGELSLKNPHAGTVVFDGRGSFRDAREGCRIDPSHSCPTTKPNNYADRVCLNQYAERNNVT